MHRHLRGLLVAAAATLASASQPFSWADAQASMHACTNESRPLVDKYAYLSTRHAVGNALDGWMHVFMYALASGRQPVVGSGVAPRLFCGREGAFSCGVPFVNDARTLGGVRRGVVGRNAAPFSDRTTDVLASDANQGYRARARAVAAARPHHSKWSPRDVAAAIADEVGRNEQKT